MTDRKRSKTEEQSFDRMLSALGEQMEEVDRLKRAMELIPPGWHKVARETPVTPPKSKVSLKLDDDMVTWFRSLSRGWQPRMNAVLRTYMHAVNSKALEGAESGTGAGP